MENFEKTQQLNKSTPSRKNGQPPQAILEPRNENQTPKINRTFSSVKEKMSVFLRYKNLKVKERFGKLNQEEFDELLDLDFQEQVQDNPPIKTVFSPIMELAKIRILPSEQKRPALGKFKELLMRQQEALAKCRVFIERNIEFNNDVPKENLMRLVEKFSREYSFTREQLQIAEHLIDSYYENRQRVLAIRQQYPDNLALVKTLTGMEFEDKAKFEVSTGPMSIDIITNHSNAARIYQNLSSITYKFRYAGFASKSKHDIPIPYIVIVKPKIRLGSKELKRTRIHEHEHQKYGRLFQQIFDKQTDYEEATRMFLQYESEQDPEIKQGLLEIYFRMQRQEAFLTAKDEVLAMKKDRDDYSYNIFFKKDKSSYDYLAYLRDWEPKKNDVIWQKTAKKILVKEYRKIFKRSIAAFDRIRKKGKYSREEVIALLTDKPMSEWPKTARRLLEQN